MSFSVKSLDRTVFSQSAMKVSIKNQATRGQGSIAGPTLTHAALRWFKSQKAPGKGNRNKIKHRRGTRELLIQTSVLNEQNIKEGFFFFFFKLVIDSTRGI